MFYLDTIAPAFWSVCRIFFTLTCLREQLSLTAILAAMPAASPTAMQVAIALVSPKG